MTTVEVTMEAQPADPPDQGGKSKDAPLQQETGKQAWSSCTSEVDNRQGEQVSQDAPVQLPKDVGNGEKQQESGKKAEKKASRGKNSALQATKKKGRQRVQQCSEAGDDLATQIAGMTISESVPAVPNGTGLVYDERLTRHACPVNSRNFMTEHSDRILQCHRRLDHYKLTERCTNVPVRLATDEEILSLHSVEYLESLKATQSMDGSELKSWAEQYDSIFVNNHTFECASLVLGGLLDLTEKVVKGELRNGITITRPPGHHAQQNMANGFCLFNNVALAAHTARHKWNCQRVLIVDWDVHHGQGVQYFFEEDPCVLYFSIHRFERGDFWPNLMDSDCNVFGKGSGLGCNINVPWNKIGMGDSEYLAVFHQLLLPLAYEFNPDLVLVCCGFDAAIGDPEGEMRVTPAAYAHLTHALMGLAGGKVVLALEGGYNFKVTAECSAMCTQTLLGDPCPLLPQTTEPDKSAVETILDVIKNIRPYWACFEYQEYVGQYVQSDVVSSTSSDKPLTQAGETDQSPESDAAQGAEPADGTGQSPSSVTVKEVESGEIDRLIDRLLSEVIITPSKHRTCLVYDEEMMQHKTAFLHPERPDRISCIFSKHQELGLVQRCHRVESRRATTEELHQCHSAQYIESLQAMQGNTSRELSKMQDNFNSIYLHQSSFDCASLAVGSTLNVVDAVLSGEAQNGLAIVRPPGHHAESNTAMGFCFFNTVAIAARYAQHKHGLKRILILDWDIHHGNGTQHAFESDPSVLYISLHRYENGLFFPSSPDGAADRAGEGKGEGYTVNIAWCMNSMGDAEYIAAFMQVVMPIAYEFCPELVLVSAGFDAAYGDPLGGYNVTPDGYAHMTHMLSSLANGRVVLALEGGYNLNSISESMAMCTRTLLGEPCQSIFPGMPCHSAILSILETLHVHQEYWKCLQYQVELPDTVEDLPADEVTSTESGTICSSSGAVRVDGGSRDTDDLTVTSSKEEKQDASRQPAPCHSLDGAGDSSSNDETSPGAVVPTVGEAGENSQTGELGAAGGIAPADKSTVATGTTIAEVFGSQAQLFAVVPLPWCPHLESHVSPNPATSPINTADPCSECEDTSENWVCLQCYKVLCGRYVNEHMLFHSLSTSHLMVLSYTDLSVWCYGCDSYVHNQIVVPVKRAAHISKFGCEDPSM